MSTWNKIEDRPSEKYELSFIRLLDAPVETVWKAWTEPESLVRWWGPKRLLTRSGTMDLRPGGKLVLYVRSPEGQEFCCLGVFREIVPMKRITAAIGFTSENVCAFPAFLCGTPAERPLETTLTVIFQKLEGMTRIIVQESGVPEKMRVVTAQGWNESLEKLAEYLR